MLARFVEEYGLSEYDAGVLTSDRDLASFYEAVAAEVDPKQASNWISGDLRALLNETGTYLRLQGYPEHERADRTRRSRQGLALRCKNGPR